MIIEMNTPYVKGAAELCFPHYASKGDAILGHDPETGEHLFTATVCLEEQPSQNCVWLKGWSENIGIPQALVDAKIVQLTGRTIHTGHCEALEAQILRMSD
ncbi:MAG TPA: hypothetical protein VMW24_26940 [Sedimentisphaerales bacterium]|nr:hypothetical protein [Sedimentisphaerales bacterium]